MLLPPPSRYAHSPQGCEVSAAGASGLPAWVSASHPLRVIATDHPHLHQNIGGGWGQRWGCTCPLHVGEQRRCPPCHPPVVAAQGLQLGAVLQAMLLRLLEGVLEGLWGGLRGLLTVRESLVSRTA